MIRILLVDDHQLMREGLRAIFEKHEDITVVGEAGDGRKAMELAALLTPDIVVIDVGMPDLNGIEATRRIIDANPKVKVIAVSTYADKRYVLAMLEAGASGYVLKAAAGEELLRAIRAIGENQNYLSPGVTMAVVEDRVKHPGAASPAAGDILSTREREVLQMVAEGRRSRHIAKRLGVTVNTVESHRRNIMVKLGLRTVAELTKYAVREGLTSLDT